MPKSNGIFPEPTEVDLADLALAAATAHLQAAKEMPMYAKLPFSIYRKIADAVITEWEVKRA